MSDKLQSIVNNINKIGDGAEKRVKELLGCPDHLDVDIVRLWESIIEDKKKENM